MYFNRSASLFDEEYNTYRVPQSEGPIKYVLSGPRGGPRNEFSQRVVHMTGNSDVDRPVLTNLNELPEYNTDLTGRNPLMTRHIFSKESEIEGHLRPVSSGRGPFLDVEIDRFDPNLLEVRRPSNMWFQPGAPTRVDERNQAVLNRN